MKVNDKYAADVAKKEADEAAAAAKGCACVGGSEYGNFCEAGSYPWCYLPTEKSCPDAIKECDASGCKWWSEEPCMDMHQVPAVAPWQAITAEHSTYLETSTSSAAATNSAEPSCKCKG